MQLQIGDMSYHMYFHESSEKSVSHQAALSKYVLFMCR